MGWSRIFMSTIFAIDGGFKKKMAGFIVDGVMVVVVANAVAPFTHPSRNHPRECTETKKKWIVENLLRLKFCKHYTTQPQGKDAIMYIIYLVWWWFLLWQQHTLNTLNGVMLNVKFRGSHWGWYNKLFVQWGWWCGDGMHRSISPSPAWMMLFIVVVAEIIKKKKTNKKWLLILLSNCACLMLFFILHCVVFCIFVEPAEYFFCIIYFCRCSGR